MAEPHPHAASAQILRLPTAPPLAPEVVFANPDSKIMRRAAVEVTLRGIFDDLYKKGNLRHPQLGSRCRHGIAQRRRTARGRAVVAMAPR